MSKRTLFIALTLLVSLGLLLPVMAKPLRVSIELFDTVTLAGTELQPGIYWLQADDDTFRVSRDKQVLVEGPANWVSCAKPRETMIVTSEGVIREIRIKGQDRCLTFAK
jgi:hypothetical protein